MNRQPSRLFRKTSEDARQYAYRVIKSEILALDLLPGQKMNEIDIATSLDISRTPVHDTLFKLSRENLADMIPQRGAFVSKIDPVRIENAVWLHTKLGISMIHALYINRLGEAQLQVFRHILKQLKTARKHSDAFKTTQLICDFYRQFYLFGGRFDHLWQSLQKSDLDLRRLLYLSAADAETAKHYDRQLNTLLEAIAARNTELACRLFETHMQTISGQTDVLKKRYPAYFTAACDCCVS